MKKSSLLIFALMLFLWTSGQKISDIQKQNCISISSGFMQFKEENVHPKVFGGLGISSIFQHSVIRRNISELDAGFSISLTNNVYESFPSSANIIISGDYKYLYHIFDWGKAKYYLGPVTDLNYGASTYFNWDESHIYYANFLSGGISNRIAYSGKNKTFVFNLEFPLLSCIFRPELNREYKIDNMTFGGVASNLLSNPEVGSFNKNFFVKTGIEMRYTTDRNNQRAIGYNFKYHYMCATGGNPYQNIGHLITYKFIF